MSITSELKNPHSAASLWLDANFELDAVARGLGAQVEGSDTIRPGGNLKDYPWSIVGSAVEFRLRQACGVQYYSTTAQFGRVGRSFTDAMFHDALALLWDDHQAEEATSRVNAWTLYFAGVCEGIYRSGRSEGLARYGEVFSEMEISHAWARFRIQMDQLRQGVLKSVASGRHPCVGQLTEMMAVPEAALDDIARVSDAAIASANFQAIRQNTAFVDDPVFVGGAWVGGVDGMPIRSVVAPDDKPILLLAILVIRAARFVRPQQGIASVPAPCRDVTPSTRIGRDEFKRLAETNPINSPTCLDHRPRTETTGDIYHQGWCDLNFRRFCRRHISFPFLATTPTRSYSACWTLPQQLLEVHLEVLRGIGTQDPFGQEPRSAYDLVNLRQEILSGCSEDLRGETADVDSDLASLL